MPRACPEPGASRSRRGGRRLGSGAPRGNLNALKHGLRSKQFAQLGAILASSPAARQSLLALAERHRLKQRRADELAAYILSQVLQRGLKRGRDRLIVLPPEPERRSIKRNAVPAASAPSGPPRHNRKRAPDNQTADTESARQSAAGYGKELD